jgi:hypothetical protein
MYLAFLGGGFPMHEDDLVGVTASLNGLSAGAHGASGEDCGIS